MMQSAGWATGSRLAISAAIGLAASAASVLGGPCSKTTSTLFDACSAEVGSTSLVKKANCFNISDANARSACVDEGKAERKEGDQLCQEQRDGRLEACHLLGEGRVRALIHGPELELLEHLRRIPSAFGRLLGDLAHRLHRSRGVLRGGAVSRRWYPS
jgi:hypothetical protein